jgi:hypothetical protein
MFSIICIYWGNQDNLDKFISHCSEYTDDIVIGHINLLDQELKTDKATIVNIPYELLLDGGYYKPYRILEGYAKYNWVFILGISERFESVNKNVLSSLTEDSKLSAYKVVGVVPYEGDAWLRLYNTRRMAMAGRIHEYPSNLVLVNNPEVIKNKIAAFITKTNYSYTNEREENIVNGYRLLTRIKWLSQFSDPENQFGPAAFWWTGYDNSLAKQLYEEHKHLYLLPKQKMIEEFAKRNDWRQYPL